MGQHLARHGLKVDVNRIAGGNIDVADALLSHAADCGADFMVMGGYGHSRLREFVLGGVTHSIFALDDGAGADVALENPAGRSAQSRGIMAFKLYNAPQSTCSQRVRFVLNAKKLPFAEVKLDLLAGDQLKPDYLALNPNGVVPTLDHDGAIVIDSSVIIEYLDEIAPAPANFTPRDPVMRAKMRSLLHFIDEMPAAAVRVPTFNLAFLPRFAAMSEEEFMAFAESKPLRKEFMLAMGRKGFPQKDMDAAHGAAAPHLRAHGRGDRKERRPVAPRPRHFARGHFADAGDRAHGRSWPREPIGRICRGCSAGTRPSAPIRPSRRPIIRARY